MLGAAPLAQSEGSM